jgi:cation diffusion facilitator CzcD-associated flavoprotein CzcO
MSTVDIDRAVDEAVDEAVTRVVDEPLEEAVDEALDVDVLIVGAGLSGIDMAARMTQLVPDHTFAILEARAASGGTWDLFRYPGIRSDSDMYTLAFPFRPWTNPRAIADGPSILRYLRETVSDLGLDEHLHYGQQVVSASWSSDTARWSVVTRTAHGTGRHTARFLYLATGYYDYDRGHVVDLPGRTDFTGEIVHPQFWPQDLQVRDRRFVVIGSGATAVTLVPALVAQGAAHVTMLQRSPTWVVSLPGADPLAAATFGLLPERTAHRALRAKNIASNVTTYTLARRFPRAARALLTAGAKRALPDGYAVSTHFNPRYDPWDQRLCVVPDGDLFAAIGSGRAEIVTDTIEALEPDGIRTSSGDLLPADVDVTATGLELVAAGKIALDVDGRPVDLSEGHVYKGLMLSDLPNLAWCVGYTNNSWTLRSDLAARWTCGLLRHLRDTGAVSATPRHRGGGGADRPIIDLSSGYIARAADRLPKQGAREPWVFTQNYLRDRRAMRARGYDDGHLEFAESVPAGR